MEVYQIQLIESFVALVGYLGSLEVAKRIIEGAALKYDYPKPRVKVTLKIVRIVFFLLFASLMLFIWGVNQWGDDCWREVAAIGDQPSSVSRWVGHARWAKNHGYPWISRRLRGVSSGDGVEPKYWDYKTVRPLVD